LQKEVAALEEQKDNISAVIENHIKEEVQMKESLFSIKV